MSGGHFDYDQHKIGTIAESIQSVIDKNGKKKTDEELQNSSWSNSEWYSKYPEETYHHKYSDEVINEFKKGVELLKQAQVYAQRIDWLLSGDDGEETFLKRLKEDLNKLYE
jgi:hypothetical protein